MIKPLLFICHGLAMLSSNDGSLDNNLTAALGTSGATLQIDLATTTSSTPQVVYTVFGYLPTAPYNDSQAAVGQLTQLLQELSAQFLDPTQVRPYPSVSRAMPRTGPNSP